MKLKTIGATLVAFALSFTAAQAADPAESLLTPDNHTLLLIDHQPQMAFATKSIDVAELRNNTVGLAKSAKLFNVPTILTTVAAESFSGYIFPEIQAVFPDQVPIDRTTMNTWEDDNVVNVIKENGRKKVVMAGLWTEVCVVLPALSAIEQGYDVYIVTDASGGVTDEAHDMAVQRMIDAGATPITWVQYLLELQRDWARGETYAGTMAIAKEHAGGYGLGVIYAEQMFGAKEGK
ncbi:hydrolase [Mameliella sediminis]|uniref:hydrolase n=1 Tax=Mameliella sediminis TaxID=2836866 RepID=UPI001C43E8B2|nr:hydrolase [Mameliella sediminis]MBY6114298.1 hydrolase [Antarctobacter heliothermus]MBY6143871.1 hydrolase [Mameliella alba]MBV7393221.1 hydrolase [Mameliella sediminis]MBY6163307.1 hydrolase [Mameliella alba]MBY6171570.1 hydrolase [Mameliella alba]